MPDDLEEILKRLPRLDQSGLEAVRKRVLALKKMSAGDPLPEGQEVEERLVLDAIMRYCKSKGMGVFGERHLRNARSYPAFKDKIEKLFEYVKNVTTDRVEQTALLMLGLQLLQRELEKVGLHVGPRVFMDHIHNLPIAIDREFPGYAEQGLMRFVIKRYSNG